MSKRTSPADDEASVKRCVDLIRDKIKKPKAFRPLAYGHPLGPSGNAPLSFGHCGRGNASGGFAKLELRMEAHYGLVVPMSCSTGWDFGAHEQTERFDGLARGWRNAQRRMYRKRASGGITRPLGRPRTIDPERERQARELLAAGQSIRATATAVGTGLSFVQRIRREMDLEAAAEAVPLVDAP
jgi:hypothetical protein